MKGKNKTLTRIAAIMLWLFAGMCTGFGQVCQLTNWVEDPFSASPDYGVTGAQSSSPIFKNTGTGRGTLYANCPITEVLKLAKPGDSVAFTGQVTLAGDLNLSGNLQFRVGLYCQGSSEADTNWLGYTIGNFTGDGGGAATGLMIRNNPNQGIYMSVNPGNAMRPKCDVFTYLPGWGAGTYDFSLSVTQVAGQAQRVDWKLAAASPGTYSHSGTYTNAFALTEPPYFDQVGIMGGAALFNSASTANIITFKNLKLTLVH